MEPYAFRPGDIVMLASGGPEMTVAKATKTKLECIWFSDYGYVRNTFHPDLILAVVDHDDEPMRGDTAILPFAP